MAQSSSSTRRKKEQEIRVSPPENIEYPGFSFNITHKDSASKARIGRLETPHGTIETPNYIFCGTKASIKNLSPAAMRAVKTDIILANTYHVMIQPGADLVEKMGGLHKFMQWDGPMMTDSGGFQIFSMGHGSVSDEIKGRNKGKREKSVLKITEEGARFQSYWNGSMLDLTPESSMKIQRQLGADLIYQLDECTAYHVDRDYTARSMERSHRWGDRSLAAFAQTHDGTQALYGIVQGGVYEDLRDISCAYVNDRAFFGQAVGGSLGGSVEEMAEVVNMCMQRLREDRPVHLLGIGRIEDVFNFVRMGIDTFDCVTPTRIARHGMALLKGQQGERINLTNARYRDDPEPLDVRLDNPASRDFSRAYLHHLLKSGEMLGMQLVSQHNVATMNLLMQEVREAIQNGTLDALQKEWLP
ncbi:MAG: tRNA guanosine(34) transglycosylase Tgt [Alphaproteobacteria bacterium CG_4_9_14_3_um_filter_47_13]|nr:MAG: tRNA guanosine(34) transglycosylase Tgt [Alphaproteobacteria bacterium CG_4_9_14_3_um_filter_47_13]